MILAKFIDGQLTYAPKMLIVGGNNVWNASLEVYLEQGWKSVVYTEPPEAPTGYHYEGSWRDDEEEIVQIWELSADPEDIDDSEVLLILLGGDSE